ncbi:MAG: hypothetical protein ACRDEB_02615, partial [Chitinophagaceae bacterium]
MSISERFKRTSFIFSIVVAMAGLVVLIGWIGNITVLKSIYPHWISLKANAAICFLLAGITLILNSREKKSTAAKWIASLLSAVIFTIGTLTLLEYIFKFNSGIDELFFKDDQKNFPQLQPGRQSIFSAAYFVIFGFSYLPRINNIIKSSLIQALHLV